MNPVERATAAAIITIATLAGIASSHDNHRVPEPTPSASTVPFEPRSYLPAPTDTPATPTPITPGPTVCEVPIYQGYKSFCSPSEFEIDYPSSLNQVKGTDSFAAKTDPSDFPTRAHMVVAEEAHQIIRSVIPAGPKTASEWAAFYFDEWQETEHPRADNGRFGIKSGGDSLPPPPSGERPKSSSPLPIEYAPTSLFPGESRYITKSDGQVIDKLHPDVVYSSIGDGPGQIPQRIVDSAIGAPTDNILSVAQGRHPEGGGYPTPNGNGWFWDWVYDDASDRALPQAGVEVCNDGTMIWYLNGLVDHTPHPAGIVRPVGTRIPGVAS